MPSIRWVAAALFAVAFARPLAAEHQLGHFVHFESSHVHPLALADNGDWLYAVNTPEARLSIFEVDEHGALTLAAEVPVGFEPVSVAVRPGRNEAWVANHISDSVSVVRGRRVIDTLLVGDEPTDVVFAAGRAFISLAGKQDRVVVYDAHSREQIASIEIPGEEPRAMDVSPDGSRIAVVVLESGNQTTMVSATTVGLTLGLPPPDPPREVANVPPEVAAENPDGPGTGLIVRFDRASELWQDEAGRDWSNFVAYSLPDLDLFSIDASAEVPAIVDGVAHLGTTLFEVAFHPRTGDAWVPNTDARNAIRFEPKLRGHLVDTRVSIVSDSGPPRFVDLNPHIDYSTSPGPPGEIARSLAQPGDGVFAADGSRFYLTAFGSSKVAVLDGNDASVLERIETPGGPSGLALHEAAERLYVMSRFDNTIAVVDTASNQQVDVVGLAGPSFFDPQPASVREGRRFLYDAQASSGHGDISCATCHVFGNFDGLSWDLGDPTGSYVLFSELGAPFGPIKPTRPGLDPMKGPMGTQTLRGLNGLAPFHWRGDRPRLVDFNPAFASLLGRDAPLADADMLAFEQFLRTIALPSNPHRNLDDSLPPTITGSGDPFNGAKLFLTRVSIGLLDFTCNDCHRVPTGSSSGINRVFAGSQDMKVPHLRNVYEKLAFDPLRDRFLKTRNFGNTVPTAGFGVGHDGKSSLREFIRSFDNFFFENELDDLVDFVIAFPTGTFPCVGAQQAIDRVRSRDPGVLTRIGTLVAEARAGHCDLVLKGTGGRSARGFVYDPVAGHFLPDRSGGVPQTLEDLLADLRGGESVTFMTVPAGSGPRHGIDRDRDGCLDGDERVPDDGACHPIPASRNPR